MTDWSESEGKRPKPTHLPHIRLWFVFPSGNRTIKTALLGRKCPLGFRHY